MWQVRGGRREWGGAFSHCGGFGYGAGGGFRAGLVEGAQGGRGARHVGGGGFLADGDETRAVLG